MAQQLINTVQMPYYFLEGGLFSISSWQQLGWTLFWFFKMENKNIERLQKPYNFEYDEILDKRVSDWFLIGNLWPIMIISISYLLFVLKIGPEWMKNRQPYNLNQVMKLYNLFQVIGTSVLTYQLWYWCFRDGYFSLTCEKIDTSNSKRILKVLSVTWWVVIFKIIDLADTIFFVLRKKFNQLTYLHIHHHIIMPWIGILAIKFTLIGGISVFPVLLNSFVHVLMYSYYLMSSFGPNLQKHLIKIKRHLTTIQIVQFIIMIIHYGQLYFLPSCREIKGLQIYGVFYLPNVMAFLYLFYQFYKKSYKKQK